MGTSRSKRYWWGQIKLAMCYFGELDGTGVIEKLIQIFFLIAGCIINYTGLLLAILLIGFLPLYVYGYFIYVERLNLSTRQGKMCGIVVLLLALALSFILWLSAAIMGTWG